MNFQIGNKTLKHVIRTNRALCYFFSLSLWGQIDKENKKAWNKKNKKTYGDESESFKEIYLEELKLKKENDVRTERQI